MLLPLSTHSLDSLACSTIRIVSRCLANSSNNENQGKKSQQVQQVTPNRIVGVSDILPDLRADLFKQFNGPLFTSESFSSNSYPFLSIAKYSVPVVRERAQVVSKLVEELNIPPEKITLRLVNRFIFWQKVLGHPPVSGKSAELINQVSETAKVKAKVKTLSKIENQLRRLIPGEAMDEQALATKRQIEEELDQLKESLLRDNLQGQIEGKSEKHKTVDNKSRHNKGRQL